MKRFFCQAMAWVLGYSLSMSIGPVTHAFHPMASQSARSRKHQSSSARQIQTTTWESSIVWPVQRRSSSWSCAILFSSSDDANYGKPNFWETLIASMSQSAARKLAKKYHQDISPISQNKLTMSVLTFARVIIPSIIAGIVAYLLFPALAIYLCTTLNDAGVFAVLSQDSSQFVQNFLTVAGLLFSILVGQVRDYFASFFLER
jgi:hypothetical protein